MSSRGSENGELGGVAGGGGATGGIAGGGGFAGTAGFCGTTGGVGGIEGTTGARTPRPTVRETRVPAASGVDATGVCERTIPARSSAVGTIARATLPLGWRVPSKSK